MKEEEKDGLIRATCFPFKDTHFEPYPIETFSQVHINSLSNTKQIVPTTCTYHPSRLLPLDLQVSSLSMY
ncbi:hypothetical protein VTL71DRAFT_13488 [Oculimacula yallundae]|uniref:Uncharacterized protein n=1 Tax=Oculimacula yallundae TaxID=86028 RepID=A0ABR4CKH0_9HELO